MGYYMITTVKADEVALVQVPANWLPKRANQEQRRIDREMTKKGLDGFRVIVVSGGPGDASPLDSQDGFAEDIEEELAEAAAE
jgi:hypothetical protein